MLGLPDGITACLFDLDGVITRTATVHAAAWKEMFDEFLRSWSEQHSQPFVPFDSNSDYEKYVDGRPRMDGTLAFLESRGIELPLGNREDPADVKTLHGLANRKQELVVRHLVPGEIEVFDGSVRYVQAVRDAGIARAVVSSSANTKQVLDAVGLGDLFDARIDGIVAQERGLPGKPAPDTFLAGAEALGATPAQAAVFEDAIAGVEAGRAGNFGIVIGVDSGDQADALLEHGADIVVQDLAQLLQDEGDR